MKLSHLTLFVCFFFCVTGPLAAQITTSTLLGSVEDETGEPLIGATVVAVHEPSGTEYGITTNLDGRFTLANLRVGGPYQVLVSYVGFETQNFENLSLSLGQKLELQIRMQPAATALQEVIVTGEIDPVLNSERTGAATNISSEQLTRLPTISRSTADFYRLTPSASGNSFAGRNDQFNNFTLDGSIFNNPFGLDAATPGGQTDAPPISLDAIEQVQVNVAPYDVTQAGFTGAAINAVTKSGTNEFHGTVFGFYRNQNLTGNRVDRQSIFVPDLTQYQAGFSLGGPLVKNKLFFFVNFEVDNREDLGSNFISAGPGKSGENVSRVEEQDLLAVQGILDSAFNYTTGPYENYLHQTNNWKAIVKLDWNIADGHSLTLTYNTLDAFKEKPAHPSALGRRGPDATTLQFFNSGYRINNIIHSAIGEWRALFGSKFANNLQVGFTAFRDTRDPFSDPFPVLNINRDGIRYIVAGHEPFSINNRLDQNVYQVTNNLNVYLGSHTLTAGFSFERFDFDNSFNLGAYEPFGVPYPGGTFGPGFNSVAEFQDFVRAGNMDPVVDFARQTFADNEANDSWALAETNVGQFGLYIQDEWAVNDRLNLTFGIRMDMPLYFNTAEKIQENIDRKGGTAGPENPGASYDPSITYFDELGNPVQFDHTVLPKQTPLFSPRFGFNWDIQGDKSMQLRGGTGLFTGRLPFVWIGNQVANPDFFFYTITDPDFQFPQVWRSNLGFDFEFGGGFVFSSDFIYTKDINGMMVRNYGIKPPSRVLNDPVDQRPYYVDADKNGTPGNFRTPNNAYVFTNTSVGYSFNMTFQLQKNWGRDFYTSIAYNFLDSRDASSIEAEISGDAFDRNPALGHVNIPELAPSLYGNRHRIIGSASKVFRYGPFATTLSLFFEYVEGNRFSYTYSGDINSDGSPGSGLNDLLYIPTDAELDQMNFVADEQREAYRAFIEQDDYLSANRGSYVEKYGLLSPWYNNWDFRLLQDFNIESSKRTHTFQFSIDILNIGSLLSDGDWSFRRLPTNTQPVGVSVDPATLQPTYSFDPSLTSSFTNDFSLQSRWQMRFGLRYIF